MTLEQLILVLAGGVLSVVQELFDWFGPWLGNQSPFVKRLVTIGTLVVGGGVVFGLACAGFLGLFAPGVLLSCDLPGFYALVEIIVLLAIGSQVTHGLVKRS